MLELTEEQRRELKGSNGEVIRVFDPETKQEYVLLRAETYDRLKVLFSEESDWTPEERLHLLAESGRRAGWDDPSMDAYDNYEENRTKLCQ